MHKLRKIRRKKRLKHPVRILYGIGIFFLCIIMALGGIYIYNDRINRSVIVTEYSIASKKLPESFEGYSIMVISDYHNAIFWRDISDKINAHRPDMLLFTGDLTQLHANLTGNLEKLIKSVNYSVPKYFVSGNHESMSIRYEELMEEIEDLGVTNIDDKAVEIYDDNKKEHIKLIGVKDPVIEDTVVKYNLDKIERMKEFVDYKSDTDEFVILALHRANLFPYFKDTNSSLILSGHLHGGIIRIPGIGGLISDEGLFPEYDAGVFEEEGTTMVVSRGCDYNPQKMRIFNRPEVLLVTLSRG